MTSNYNLQSINTAYADSKTFATITSVNIPSIAPVPGVPDVDSLAPFGQLNIERRAVVSYIELRQIVDGSAGITSVEIYRLRSGNMTLIASLSILFGGGDFAVNRFTPLGDLSILDGGDYIFCQSTAIQTDANGITVNVNFQG